MDLSTIMPVLTVQQELSKRMSTDQLREAAAGVRELVKRDGIADGERAFYASVADGLEKYAADREAEAEGPANDRTEPDGVVRSAQVIYGDHVVDSFVGDDHDTVVHRGIAYVGDVAWDAADEAFGGGGKTTASVTLKFKQHPAGATVAAVSAELAKATYGLDN